MTYTIAIHGGAGTILRSEMSATLEKQYLYALEQALNAGYAILEKGGTAVDTVKASTRITEIDI